MSSSDCTTFQGLNNQDDYQQTFSIYADPKEAKGKRDREYYAKNKDDILKRRRQAREVKKQSTAIANDENTLCDLKSTGESVVTQVPNKTPTGGHVF